MQVVDYLLLVVVCRYAKVVISFLKNDLKITCLLKSVLALCPLCFLSKEFEFYSQNFILRSHEVVE